MGAHAPFRHLHATLSGREVAMLQILTAAAAVLMLGGAKPPPLLSVEWTVQAREEGKLNKAYYVFHLRCCDACKPRGCALTSISLNRCSGFGNAEELFAPIVDRWSEADEDLAVAWSHEQVSVRAIEKAADGIRTVNYVVSFKCRPRERGAAFPTCELTDVAGTALTTSKLLGEAYSVEFVPLRDDVGFTSRELECKVLLPTVRRRR